MGVSPYDEAKGTSSPTGSHAAASASGVPEHYQTAANTGSRGDQYRDVTPNNDQRTNALYKQAPVVSSGHGGKHKHQHQAVRAAKKASAGAGTDAGSGTAQKLAGKSGYTIDAAAVPSGTAGAAVYDMGLSPHDEAKGTSDPAGSRGVGSAYGREHYGNPVYASDEAKGTSNPAGSRGVGSAYGREHYGNPVYTSNAVDV